MIGTDADRWSARILALTTVLGVDALAVLLPVDERLVMYSAHGVGGDDALARLSPLGPVLPEPRAMSETGIPLSDGRIAQELLAVPIRLGERPLGILVALNERHKFGEIHATRVASAADLIAVELATSNALFHSERSERTLEKRLGQAEDDRAQALLLYELGRLQPAGDRGLDLATAMLADAGHHAAVGIWVCRDGSRIDLRASRGHSAGEHQQVLGDAEWGPAAAIRKRTPQVATVAPGALRPAWAPDGADQFILAPIYDEVRDAGLLVLGRDGAPYSDGDVEFAALLASALVPFLRPPAFETAPPLPTPDPVTAYRASLLPPPPIADEGTVSDVPRGSLFGALLGVGLAELLLIEGVLAVPDANASLVVSAVGWSAFALAAIALLCALALVRNPASRGATRLLFATALAAFVARGFAVLLDPYSATLVIGLRIGEAVLALVVAVILAGRLRAASDRAG
ncbi:MAG TPA: hypothetical protein VGA38_07910 [Candidatus Limnocylindria bacterium]